MVHFRFLVAALLALLTATGSLFVNAGNNVFDAATLEDLRKDFGHYCVDGRVKAEFSSSIDLCFKVAMLKKSKHDLESILLCSHGSCRAQYDPVARQCQCSRSFSSQKEEHTEWPDKNCTQLTNCDIPYTPHWNPVEESCVCALGIFSKSDTDPPPIRFEPKTIAKHIQDKVSAIRKNFETLVELDAGHNIRYRHEMYLLAKQNAELIAKIRELIRQNQERQQEIQQLSRDIGFQLDDVKASLETIKAMVQSCKAQVEEFKAQARNFKARISRKFINKRQPTASGAVSLAPLPTYIPPPNTKVTQQLIQESLLIQPQQNAFVHSVIPSFAEGVITFLVQLDGPISQTLALNATDTLPCATIGTEPQPNLILLPKTVKGGSPQISLPTCLVIAVNMYEPNVITYWIQKEDGTVFSVLSDSKIHAIDQLDTSQPAAIVIRVVTSNSTIKRSDTENDSNIHFKRRQIFSVTYGKVCPFMNMDLIVGNDGYCGCMFKGANEKIDLAPRGIEQPTPYTATMTAEACAAMICLNNDNKPAVFNPFTATCWCTTPVYIETNNSTSSH